MPTSKQVSRLKAEQIDKKKKVINNKINDLQQNLYDKISSQFVTLINKKENKPSFDNTNQMQSVIKKEFNKVFPEIIKDTVKSARSLTDLNNMYFSTLLDSNRLEQIQNETMKIIDRKLGIDENGQVKRNGFVDKALNDSAIQKDFIKQIKQLVQSGQDVQTVQEKLKEFMVGNDINGGFINQYYKGFAGTLLNEVDRNNNLIYADKLELQYFYYSGGLILTSRPFCLDKNGKIFTRDQADKWKDDSRIKKMYGKNISDYVPLRDFGGPNCLHNADFITDDMAIGNIRDQNSKAAARNQKFKDNNL